jgi:hypothetical protein
MSRVCCPTRKKTLEVGGASPEHAGVPGAQSKKRGRAKSKHGEVGMLTASLRDDGTTARPPPRRSSSIGPSRYWSLRVCAVMLSA